MFCAWLVILHLFSIAVGVPPQWITPKQGASFSVNAKDASSCSKVTLLDVSSADSYAFSISNNITNGEFSVEMDENYNDVLRCDVSKLFKASYTVTLSAFLVSDSSDYSEINITVTVNGLDPTFSTSESTTVNITETMGTATPSATVTSQVFIAAAGTVPTVTHYSASTEDVTSSTTGEHDGLFTVYILVAVVLLGW